jgi:hypothetical protein
MTLLEIFEANLFNPYPADIESTIASAATINATATLLNTGLIRDKSFNDDSKFASVKAKGSWYGYNRPNVKLIGSKAISIKIYRGYINIMAKIIAVIYDKVFLFFII